MANTVTADVVKEELTAIAMSELQLQEGRDATIKEGLQAVLRWATRRKERDAASNKIGSHAQTNETTDDRGLGNEQDAGKAAGGYRGPGNGQKTSSELKLKELLPTGSTSRTGRELRALSARAEKGVAWRGTRGYVYWVRMRDCGRINRERG